MALSPNPADPDGAPSLPGSIIRCGGLFEEALYSPRVLSGEERKEFERLIEAITKR
jgi:hypothetical protein